MGLVALGRFLRGELPNAPPVEWFDEESPEIQELARRSGQAWATVVEAASAAGPTGATR